MRSITFLRKLKENKRFLTLFPLPRERIGVIFITQNAKDMVGMDYKEALEYINRTEWFGSRPGLERITELLEKLGNPQNGMKFVHIAGTNGKGSCAAMTASVLKAAGYKTGLFTSPYLYRFNERMQINGKQIDDDVLAADVSLVKIAADAMADHPTEFELMTAAAMVWFKEQNCDIVVLESAH